MLHPVLLHPVLHYDVHYGSNTNCNTLPCWPRHVPSCRRRTLRLPISQAKRHTVEFYSTVLAKHALPPPSPFPGPSLHSFLPNHKNTTVPDGPRSPVRPLRHPTTRQPDIATRTHSYSHTAPSPPTPPDTRTRTRSTSFSLAMDSHTCHGFAPWHTSVQGVLLQIGGAAAPARCSGGRTMTTPTGRLESNPEGTEYVRAPSMSTLASKPPPRCLSLSLPPDCVNLDH